jgi:hypothetical protein
MASCASAIILGIAIGLLSFAGAATSSSSLCSSASVQYYSVGFFDVPWHWWHLVLVCHLFFFYVLPAYHLHYWLLGLCDETIGTREATAIVLQYHESLRCHWCVLVC